MTDKNGKKLKMGSIVALKKPGASNYTVVGPIVNLNEELGIAVMRCRRTGGLHSVRMANIKRMSYNKPKKRHWEDEF